MSNTKEKELRKVIETNKSRRIMRTYPEPDNQQVPYNTVWDTISGIWNFFFDSKIDFKKDDNGIHLKIDKDQNK